MDDRRQTLEQKVDELRKTLEQLEKQWETYYECVSRMTVSKLTDPRHRLVDWELHFLPSKAQQVRFRAAMQALQNRLVGKETPAHEQIVIEGLSKESLYAPNPPTIEEILHAIGIVTNQGERAVVQIMEAAREEFDVDYDELANFVLDSLRFQR